MVLESDKCVDAFHHKSQVDWFEGTKQLKSSTD